jgi:hypothetical protein
LEGLEAQIIYTQFLGDKVYTTVLKKSQFEFHAWGETKKTWWRTSTYDKNNFGVGYNDYYHAQYSNSKPALERNMWNGQNDGTLYVTNLHGKMSFSYNKTPTGIGSTKQPTSILDRITSFTGDVETGALAITAFSGGTSAVITIPIAEMAEIIGKIASVEKAIIQGVNGDLKKAIKTGVPEIGAPKSIDKLFDKWSKTVPSERGKERINLLNNLVNRAIEKGLDYIEIPDDNVPQTTVRENTEKL